MSILDRLGEHLPHHGRMPSLDGATAWLNSPPLQTESLRGKVVAVDFWTYTCINWLRTLPYVRAWAREYADDGLVVIGVHTPEFAAIETNIDDVRRATTAMHVSYPVALDSDYKVWNAFSNNYWPALYIVDAQGVIRHHHFGEGDYDRSERVIQHLLADAGAPDATQRQATPEPVGIEIEADWNDLGSPESYLGYERGERFASPEGVGADQRRTYTLPDSLATNQWALAGDWTIGGQPVLCHDAGGRIAYRFRARDLHLILAPAPDGSPVRFRVRLDGTNPGDAHGLDVDAEGNGTIVEPRLHQLIRQHGSVRDRDFEIELLDPGASAFCFTFG
jgi:thiol-disulfide isomerase/thioredoxin